MGELVAVILCQGRSTTHIHLFHYGEILQPGEGRVDDFWTSFLFFLCELLHFALEVSAHHHNVDLYWHLPFFMCREDLMADCNTPHNVTEFIVHYCLMSILSSVPKQF